VENVKVSLQAAGDAQGFPGRLIKKRRGTALEITIPRIENYQALTWTVK
jgi:hypothetical protein